MQLTLVSRYGKKPAHFAAFIRHIQQTLSLALAGRFSPYALEQVHGTIIGLEGTRDETGVHSANFLRSCGEDRHFDFAAMLNFLRDEVNGFDIQIGGFLPERDYGFLSQGQSPFVRSFSIRGISAVAMGWPRENGHTPLSLDKLRRDLQSFGALRKWAWREGEVDNDFYFVLGQLAGEIPGAEREQIEFQLRECLASMPPLELKVSTDTLAFVAYSDLRLPLETSRAFAVSDRATTPDSLAGVYGFCNR